MFPKKGRSEEFEDDSESEIDEDLREVVQGEFNFFLYLIVVFRL